MSKRTPLLAQAAHAKQFKDGMPVKLLHDDGKEYDARVDGEPWLMGGHTYVVNCDSVTKRFVAYNVMRVRPA